jgi:hypothetical protein
LKQKFAQESTQHISAPLHGAAAKIQDAAAEVRMQNSVLPRAKLNLSY